MKPAPYARTGMIKVIGFLIKKNKRYAYVLDNYVWGVCVREFTIEEFEKRYKPSSIAKDKIHTILRGLSSYAIYAGMTRPAARVLPLMTYMSEGDVKLAIEKGSATKAKHEAGAESDAKKDGAPKKLFGAALKSYNARLEREAAAAESAAQASGAEPKKPVVELAPEAVAAHSLAAELSADLTKIEEAGGDPEAVVAPKKKWTKPDPNAPKKVAKGFDVAGLKDAKGDWKSSSAMFKGLLLEGGKTDDQIFKAVQKKFGLDDGKKGYVAWNRGWLKRHNLLK